MGEVESALAALLHEGVEGGVFPGAVAGVSVRVDPASLPSVDGTEIDFVKSGLNQSFVFRNPRVEAECGCGESFTTR